MTNAVQAPSGQVDFLKICSGVQDRYDTMGGSLLTRANHMSMQGTQLQTGSHNVHAKLQSAAICRVLPPKHKGLFGNVSRGAGNHLPHVPSKQDGEPWQMRSPM